MTAPGPPGLGRGVIVNVGDPVPAAWAGAPVVTIDRALLDEIDAAPAERSDEVDALHGHWASRTPVVVRPRGRPGRVPRPAIAVVRPLPRRSVGPGARPRPDPRPAALPGVGQHLRRPRRGRADLVVGPQGRQGRRRRRSTPAAAASRQTWPLPDGTPAWVDGGPRGDDAGGLAAGAVVVPAESVEAGHVRPAPPPVTPAADLAPDQLAAVAHGSGPARVIAPAGSGKTRVLTERLRHLVVDRGYEPGSVVAVAYNRKARDEMASPHRRGRRPHPHAQRPRLRHRGRRPGAAARGRRRSARCAACSSRSCPPAPAA